MNETATRLRIVAMMTILRDDLEETEDCKLFSREFKQLTNRWLREANKKLKVVCDTDDTEIFEELQNIINHMAKSTDLSIVISDTNE